jgi:hypothetical protein
MDRRTVLKGGLVLAAASHSVALAPEPVTPMSVDDFLKVASPSEIVSYHTNSLLEALSGINPNLKWAAFTELDLSEIRVIGMDVAPIETHLI